MAELTLADYTGYIFLEIIKAREMADAYSRSVAARYAEDEVLKHFSTPRFRIPKMALTIPVLISGAKFSQVVKFTPSRDDFRKLVGARIADVIRTVQLGATGPVPPRVTPLRSSQRQLAVARASALPSVAVTILINTFHADLQANANPGQPANIIRAHWARIVEVALDEAKLTDSYRKQNPHNELFESSAAELTSTVIAGTLVSKTQISNLLVNPETNVVKNGSSDSSVFTIQADLTEEGFFVKTVTDPKTGSETKVVDFE